MPEPYDTTQEALEKAVNTSLYVVSMPFKLLDPGAEIQYLGEETLAGGQALDVIQLILMIITRSIR